RGHLCLGIAQPVERGARRSHPGIVQDEHVHRLVRRTFIVIGTRVFADRRAHSPRSRLMRSQAALMRATVALAFSMNSGGTPRAARASGWFSRISWSQTARSCSPSAERATPR